MFKVEIGHVKRLAEQLLDIAGVTEVYGVAGPFDLVAVVRVREHEALSDLVTERIAALGGLKGPAMAPLPPGSG